MKNTNFEDDDTIPPKARAMLNDMAMRVAAEIMKLDEQPRLQIFVTHGFLELMVSALIKSKTKNGKKILDDNRSYPYSTQILILNELSILSNQQYKVYDHFRKLRNKAAHEPLFELEKEQKNVLDPKNTDEYFGLTCSRLIANIWNDNIEILGPLFLPTLFPKGNGI
ncbi:MAG: hypothetical protein EOO46_23350 [Flavobacterium sp.]|nr:MAG: hypothetical protein EOO46_23350 [Flavobacterium sp.]